MSAVATMVRAEAVHSAAVRSAARDREPTLDRLIAGDWTQLAAHRAVDCPLCGEQMAPKYGAHALPIGGRCLSCATELT